MISGKFPPEKSYNFSALLSWITESGPSHLVSCSSPGCPSSSLQDHSLSKWGLSRSPTCPMTTGYVLLTEDTAKSMGYSVHATRTLCWEGISPPSLQHYLTLSSPLPQTRSPGTVSG